jgi:hypothetical protein
MQDARPEVIMPTLKPTTHAAADFGEMYPEDLSERLAWFARELGVSEWRLLGLLGLTLADLSALPTGGVDWRTAVSAHESEAWWAEGMLYDILALFDYDTGALRQHLAGSASRNYAIPRPGGGSVPSGTLPPAERDRALLVLLSSGGPEARQALIAYLAQLDDPAASSV